MIKANELRIGNLVEYKIKDKFDERKELWEFSEIDADDIHWLSKVDAKDEDFRPISLTEEWLLKFGFENVHTDWFYKDIGKTNSYQFCFNICLSNGKITLDSGFDENSIINIKHVHQLQNLYFALTGAELTVA